MNAFSTLHSVPPVEGVDYGALERLIVKTIEKEPMERRLYPDLYAAKLAAVVAQFLHEEG